MLALCLTLMFKGTSTWASTLEQSQNDRGMQRIVLNGSEPIAKQLDQANTIYVVSQDFNLKDPKGVKPVVVPDNCILQFEGGVLSNGTIIGTNTYIKSAACEIFGKNLNISGSWKVTDANAEWFGAIGDGKNNDADAIKKCLSAFGSVCLLSTYRINQTLNIEKNCCIYGKTGNESIIYNGKFSNSVIEITYPSFLLKDFKIEVSDPNYTGLCIYIHREEKDHNIVTHSNRPIIRGVSMIKPYVTNEYNSQGIVIADINQKGQYNISITDCNIRGFATAVHLNAINGYINSNTIERCFFWAAKTAVKISNSGSGSMVCDNKILSCSFQNAHTAVYKKKYKAIDVDNNLINIYNNVIDVYLWDIASIAGTFGSQHGTIGKLNLNNHNSFYVFCENEQNGVLIASIDAGSKVLGRSLAKIQIQSDELATDYNISSNLNSIWVNDAVSYPKKDVPLNWGGYHKLYYIKRDDIIYLYLVAQSGFHQVLLPSVGILPIYYGGGTASVKELTPLETPVRAAK